MGNETTMTMDLPVNRTYKSTVFTMLYADRGNLLDLYNAMTGKHYDDPELLEINTLENAIYMTIKNDVSFLIDGRLSLYEHQSTKNPNLPLRFLLYISHLYSRMTKDKNLYGTARVQIPAPEFVVFYNGREWMPDASGVRGLHRQDPAVHRGDVPGGGGRPRHPGMHRRGCSERIS